MRFISECSDVEIDAISQSQSQEKIRPSDICGKCFVTYETDDTAIDAWAAHNGHYYVNESADSLDFRALDDLNLGPRKEFWRCVQCHEEHNANLARRAQQLQRFDPLRGLELFAGLNLFFVTLTGFNTYIKVRPQNWIRHVWLCGDKIHG
jgi:hypothetical protein